MKPQCFVMADHLSITGETLAAHAHRHDFIHLMVSLGDEPLTVLIEGREYSGYAVLINRAVVHRMAQQNQPFWLALINHTSSLAACLRHRLLADGRTYSDVSELFTAPARKARSLLCESITDRVQYEALWHEVLEALSVSKCYQPHEISDARIRRIFAALRKDDYLRSDSDILDKIYLSRSRLSHLFTDTTGGSLKSYILFHRLIEALLQVSQGGTVTEAALNTGFNSPSHLSSTCRKLMGIQPRFAKRISRILKVLS